MRTVTLLDPSPADLLSQVARADPDLARELESWPVPIRDQLLKLSASFPDTLSIEFLRVFVLGDLSTPLDSYVDAHPESLPVMREALSLQGRVLIGPWHDELLSGADDMREEEADSQAVGAAEIVEATQTVVVSAAPARTAHEPSEPSAVLLSVMSWFVAQTTDEQRRVSETAAQRAKPEVAERIRRLVRA